VGTPSTVLVRKKVLDEINGFDENKRIQSFEDWDLWLQIAQKYQFNFIPEVLTNYYIMRQV
jgi:GT2 family glycosyltransferase